MHTGYGMKLWVAVCRSNVPDDRQKKTSVLRHIPPRNRAVCVQVELKFFIFCDSSQSLLDGAHNF